MADITVFGFPHSSFVHIAQLVLAHKDVPYTFHDLEPDMGSRKHLALHPFDRVPILQHGDFVLYETSAIALYLTDAFPEAGLGPKIGEADRGAYVTWLSYYSGVFEPSFTAKFLKLQHIYGTFGWAPFEEVVEHLTATLQRGPYFLGEHFSAVDVVFGGSLPFLMSGQILPESDIFKNYVANCPSG